jgi:hypothetical protein
MVALRNDRKTSSLRMRWRSTGNMDTYSSRDEDEE